MKPILDTLFYVAIACCIAAPCVALLLWLPPAGCIAFVLALVFINMALSRWTRRRARWLRSRAANGARMFEHG
jgi:membrane protein implicated in regulation of membrane protease activity